MNHRVGNMPSERSGLKDDDDADSQNSAEKSRDSGTEKDGDDDPTDSAFGTAIASERQRGNREA